MIIQTIWNDDADVMWMWVNFEHRPIKIISNPERCSSYILLLHCYILVILVQQ